MYNFINIFLFTDLSYSPRTGLCSKQLAEAEWLNSANFLIQKF